MDVRDSDRDAFVHPRGANAYVGGSIANVHRERALGVSLSEETRIRYHYSTITPYKSSSNTCNNKKQIKNGCVHVTPSK